MAIKSFSSMVANVVKGEQHPITGADYQQAIRHDELQVDALTLPNGIITPETLDQKANAIDNLRSFEQAHGLEPRSIGELPLQHTVEHTPPPQQ